MPATMKAMQTIRAVDAESPNMKMPTVNAPSAPIPVHTAQAVSIGMIRCAYKSSARAHRHGHLPHLESAQVVLRDA
jgi:hypothetical protein